MSDDRDIEVLYDKALAATRTKRIKGATVEKRSRIPTEAQYERAEFDRAIKQEEEVNKAPLADRKEATASFLDAMKNDPELVGVRVSWLLDGNYGKGAHMRAHRILENKRMNRKAALTHLIGIYEWQTPARMGIADWKKLTHAEKRKLDASIQDTIETSEAEAASAYVPIPE